MHCINAESVAPLECSDLSELSFSTDADHGLRFSFIQNVWPKKAVTSYHHRQSGCTLLLPDNKINERPRPADLVGIRGDLAYRGLLTEKEFDHFVEQGKLTDVT